MNGDDDDDEDGDSDEEEGIAMEGGRTVCRGGRGGLNLGDIATFDELLDDKDERGD